MGDGPRVVRLRSLAVVAGVVALFRRDWHGELGFLTMRHGVGCAVNGEGMRGPWREFGMLRITVALALVAVLVPAGMAGQEPAGRVAVTAGSNGTSLSELRRYDQWVDALARTDELVLASRRPDRYLPGRVHEGFLQHHRGVPVHGGGVSRQLDRGVAVSIFGTVHAGIGVGTSPALSADEALNLVAQRTGARAVTAEPPALVVLPTFFDTYVLAWRVAARDLRTYFVDARSGAVVHDERNVDEQGAVGAGIGIRGQRKKLSTSPAGGGFQAHDRLRRAEIVTLDVRHDEERRDGLVDPDGPRWLPSDVASDADNEWSDAAVVDAHAHAGFTHDYLAQYGWNGIDGRNGRMMSMVNIGRDFANAFFAHPPAGPEGTGVVAFGRERDGAPIVSADIVAHEIMHGVTWFSVRQRTGEPFRSSYWAVRGPPRFTFEDGFTAGCGMRYRYPDDAPRVFAGRVFEFACAEGGLLLLADEGGAVNEAWSDIIGTGLEFSLHERASGPLRADYTIGEDTGRIHRSLENPRSLTLGADSRVRYPDARSGMVRFLVEVFEDGETWFSDAGSVDGGRTLTRLPSHGYSGVHWNSTILSHAFHLVAD